MTDYCPSPKDMRLRRVTVLFGRGPKPSYQVIPVAKGGLEEDGAISARVRIWAPNSRLRTSGGRRVLDKFYTEDPK